MDNEELKEALINQKPIVVNHPVYGILQYAYVSAVIYRRDKNGNIYVEAELMDKNKHSVSIADPKHISYIE